MEDPDALTHSPPANAATLAEGLKDSLPIVISYIPGGLAFGLNATKLGFTPLESLFFSCIIYAGASQFVITAVLAAGSSLWSPRSPSWRWTFATFSTALPCAAASSAR